MIVYDYHLSDICINMIMSFYDTSMVAIDHSRVMLLIVVLLTEDSRSAIYDHNMFIVQRPQVQVHRVKMPKNHSWKLIPLVNLRPVKTA